MSDHLDRAAEVIAAQMHGLTTPSMCRGIARARQETARERDELRAEVVRLRTALDDLVDDWEDTGRSDLHPLIRGAALSTAGQVRQEMTQ